MSASTPITPEKVGILRDDLTPPLMTFDEFLEWADEDTHAEWVNGRVIFLSASSRHQLVMFFIARLIADWLEETQAGGAVYMPPFLMRCRAGMPGREPDVLYVSETNADRVQKNYLDGAADLVVEIVSPESIRRDHDEKFAEYEAGGVGEYWIIDPVAGYAEFYVRDAGSRYFRRGTLEGATRDSRGIYSCDLLGGLRINADWLFAEPLPLLAPIRRDWQTLKQTAPAE